MANFILFKQDCEKSKSETLRKRLFGFESTEAKFRIEQRELHAVCVQHLSAKRQQSVGFVLKEK
jgi:hypothetical protein